MKRGREVKQFGANPNNFDIYDRFDNDGDDDDDDLISDQRKDCSNSESDPEENKGTKREREMNTTKKT